MIYYHVSLDIEENISLFKPIIPDITYQLENKSISRICLSDSIAGCLTAVPWGGRKLENTSCFFHELTDGEILLIFKVYEFESEKISSQNIISTNELLEKGYVLDACASNEIWVVNQNLVPTTSYNVLLKRYNENNADIYSHEFYLLSDEEHALIDFDDYMIGCATVIEDIEYEQVDNLDNFPYLIDWQDWRNERYELKMNNYEFVY